MTDNRELATEQDIEAELLRSYAPKVLKDKETADRNSDELIRLNMERGESDNITAAVIKVTI